MQKQESNLIQNGGSKTTKTTKVYDKDQLKKKLTPLQFRVTQDKITERPFSGEYLKLNDNGMYCCVVCGEELFSSTCKFDSGCGWPAFSDVTDGRKVKLTLDTSHGGNLLLLALKPDMARTEVACASCNSHLGHLFDDGPKPTGKRYCINSAALQFYKSSSNQDNNSNSNNKSNNELLSSSSSSSIKTTTCSNRSTNDNKFESTNKITNQDYKITKTIATKTNTTKDNSIKNTMSKRTLIETDL